MTQENWPQAITIYFLLAIGYNLLSQILRDTIGRGLAPTDPMNGLSIMTVFALWLWLGDAFPKVLFLFVTLSFLYMIVRYGVVQHLLNFSADTYLSRLSWLAAMTINVFGVCSIAFYLANAELGG